MKLIYMQIFSPRGTSVFLHLGTLASSSTLSMETILISEIANPKEHKNTKIMALNRPGEGHTITK